MDVILAFISPSRVSASFAYTVNSKDGEGTGIICGTLTVTALRSWNLFNTERYSVAWAIHFSLCRTQRCRYIAVALFPGAWHCISLTSSLSQDSLWTKDTQKSHPEHLTSLQCFDCQTSQPTCRSGLLGISHDGWDPIDPKCLATSLPCSSCKNSTPGTRWQWNTTRSCPKPSGRCCTTHKASNDCRDDGSWASCTLACMPTCDRATKGTACYERTGQEKEEAVNTTTGVQEVTTTAAEVQSASTSQMHLW